MATTELVCWGTCTGNHVFFKPKNTSICRIFRDRYLAITIKVAPWPPQDHSTTPNRSVPQVEKKTIHHWIGWIPFFNSSIVPKFNPKKSKRRQILPGSKDSTTPQMPVMVSAQTKATLGVTWKRHSEGLSRCRYLTNMARLFNGENGGFTTLWQLWWYAFGFYSHIIAILIGKLSL